MQPLGNLRDHFWRVIKMAKACNVDLSTALDEGQIELEDYTQMVADCRGCTHVGACDRALVRIPVLDEAPDYCTNRDVFDRLRKV
ncbi:DUF6455 family protein [Yoonia sp. BS5-3]|uniref:DUF6455 family protein n=1 Tax=Yoonia phaeophyticola TaxID=3137369 RepID=A0ABZ2UYV1_9RHOB